MVVGQPPSASPEAFLRRLTQPGLIARLPPRNARDDEVDARAASAAAVRERLEHAVGAAERTAALDPHIRLLEQQLRARGGDKFRKT